MRFIALAFALITSTAFACPQIPTNMRFSTLSGDFMTLTADLTMKVEFVDLSTAECVLERSGSVRVKDGATVSVIQNGKTVQSWTATVSFAADTLFVGKPANMVMGGVEINRLENGTYVMFYDRAAMKPTVTF